MNCKKTITPGMLVMLLPTPNVLHRAHAGEVHIVGESSREFSPFNGWHTAWRMDPPVIEDGINLWWVAEFLRPLDNPDPDARDETLSWLPVPKHEHDAPKVREGV